MHVASVMSFEGEAPAYDELRRAIEARLHLVPRYRQRLAASRSARDARCGSTTRTSTSRYHLRHSALPAPGGDEELKRLGRPALLPAAGPRQAAVGDLARRRAGRRGRAALRDHRARPITRSSTASRASTSRRCSSTHPRPGARRGARPRRGSPRPPPTAAQLLADALRRAGTVPARDRARRPRAAARPARAARQLAEPRPSAWRDGPRRPAPRAALALQRPDRPAPPLRRGSTPTSTTFKAIKDELGGTVNDAVLDRRDARARALAARARRTPPRASCCARWCPVSVRADAERGALGNRVAAMYAPLPVGVEDPRAAFAPVHEAMAGLKALRAGGRRAGASRSSATSRRRRSSARPRGCRPASAASTSS